MLLELVFPVRLGGSGLEFFMKPSKAMYESLVEIIVYQHCCLVPLTKWEHGNCICSKTPTHPGRIYYLWGPTWWGTLGRGVPGAPGAGG